MKLVPLMKVLYQQVLKKKLHFGCTLCYKAICFSLEKWGKDGGVFKNLHLWMMFSKVLDQVVLWTIFSTTNFICLYSRWFTIFYCTTETKTTLSNYNNFNINFTKLTSVFSNIKFWFKEFFRWVYVIYYLKANLSPFTLGRLGKVKITHSHFPHLFQVKIFENIVTFNYILGVVYQRRHFSHICCCIYDL